MTLDHDPTAGASPCLVLVRPEPQGSFTAQLVGLDAVHVTADTPEAAVEGVRSMVRNWIEAGKLLPIDVRANAPLMSWFGHAKDDPDFDDYVEEIRRQRQGGGPPAHATPDEGE
ncbi:MAG: hypothetical protein U0790_28620 [Isosphaeraceae bacterium]